MDRISGLTDELLIKILLFLPTKVAVSTSLLSKRWEFVWMWLPKLVYDQEYADFPPTERKMLRCFIDRNLPLHRAPVIESLSLRFNSDYVDPKEIKMWVGIAVSRIIREMDITFGLPLRPVQNILPSNLFTCKSLVSLRLIGKMLVNVPRMVCLPCLKTLELRVVVYANEDCFQRFVSNCPVLEDLSIHRDFGDVIKKLTLGVSTLRRLTLFFGQSLEDSNILPSNLYTCKLLVTLKLNAKILLDVPRMVCLPSLKTLHLSHVTYLSDGCLQRLLSNCPVLEDLSVVHELGDGIMKKFDVIVPSLQRLSLCILYDVEFVIKTPSLKYLKLVHRNSKSHYCSMENMPQLMEAYLDVKFPDLKSLMRSIASVKSLEFCLTPESSEVVYGDGLVFNNLEHLKLCSCPQYLSNVLVWLLKDSPKLHVLDLYQMGRHDDNDGLVYWTQPSTVPECMLSSLLTFSWSGYFGRPQERDLFAYILENTHRLKTATISPDDECSTPGIEMLKELALCSRASAACKLVFESNKLNEDSDSDSDSDDE